MSKATAIGYDLWVGGMEATDDLEFITKNKIRGILNVAHYLDVSFPFENDEFRHFPIEYAKVGLVDGPEPHKEIPKNNDGSLIAAVLILDQLVTRRGRVLVHCHMGGSRSVIVVSLYLSIKFTHAFDDLLDALNYVLEKRNLIPFPYPHNDIESSTKPMPGLYRLARKVYESHVFDAISNLS